MRRNEKNNFKNYNLLVSLNSIIGGILLLQYFVPVEEKLLGKSIGYSSILSGISDEIIILILGLLILIGGIGFFIYGFIQKNLYKNLYENEKELWNSREKFKVTIDSIGEGVITTDTDGKIQYLNKRAEKLTGWSLKEAKGMFITDVYSVINEETDEKEVNIIDKVLKQGIVKELANHTILINRLGKRIPVIDTGAPIFNAEKKAVGLVLTFQDETEKRAYINLLKEDENRFRSSLENMIEGCQILDFDFKYIYINRAAEIHNARPREELLGKRYMDMWPGIENTEVFKKIKSSLLERIDYVMENKFYFPDGKVGWFELKIQPIDNGVLILSYDITEKKLMNNQQSKLAKAVKHSPVSVIITDIDGKIEYANPKFCEITGYSFEEVIGENPNILKSGFQTNEYYQELWNTILSGKEWNGEIKNKNKSGEFYWESALISPIFNEEGQVTNFVGVKQDITERRKMLQELVKAKEKAEESNSLKSHFFSNMSHELRTPFVGIMGYAELLSEVLTNNEEKEMALGIVNTSKRIMETLTRILSLSRLELNAVHIVKNKFDVKEVIESVYEAFKPAAESRNLNFTKHIFFDLLEITTDKELFIEILKNLVSNALHYTNEGSIEIKAYTESKEKSSILKIEVSDTGIGIPNDKLGIIWEEFRQVNEGITKEYHGIGLGLAIVKKYTELLKGKISLLSEVAVGSTFTLELPIKEELKADTELKKADEKIEIIPRIDLAEVNTKRKILHIEDDEITRKVIRHVLTKEYLVDSADNPQEALNFVKENRYDVILMDIALGTDISGGELAKMIRKFPHYSSIPIIAVTAYASDKDKREFLASGLSHYIAKPFMMKDLTDLIKEALEDNK